MVVSYSKLKMEYTFFHCTFHIVVGEMILFKSTLPFFEYCIKMMLVNIHNKNNIKKEMIFLSHVKGFDQSIHR